MKDFLDISDFSKQAIQDLLSLARDMKRRFKSGEASDALQAKTLGMLFQKPSTRTRLSFEVGMSQLGGRAIYLNEAEIGIGEREPVEDVARVMSRYLDGVMFRAKSHADIKAFATSASIPVINGLSDESHPCQALADALSIWECFDRLEGVKLAYIGDVNNVCVSLMRVAKYLDMDMVVACPEAYLGDVSAYDWVRFETDPVAAVKDADVVYTDVWVSMGQESDAADRLAAFSPFQVNDDLLAQASSSVRFMHCLPARRGEEVTNLVMEGPKSIVFDQAENRMHAQKAVLLTLMG